jgi:hypothetical protein
MRKLPNIVNYILIASAISIFVLSSLPRFIFPFEVNWGEGSMYYQVQRVLEHKSLYSQPSIYYVAWLYEPMYYYASAFITKFTGLSFISIRIISLISTIILLSIIFKVLQKETKSAFLGLAGIALYLAAYGRTAFCMIVARVDPLFLLFLIASFVAIYYSRNYRTLCLAAVFLSLAYFTKQTTLLFLPAIVLYLWKIKGWKTVAVFLTAFSIVMFVGFVTMYDLYGKWFSYYTLQIPSAKTKTLSFYHFYNNFFYKILLQSWFISSLLLIFPVILALKKTMLANKNGILLFGLFFMTSLGAGCIAMLYQGGDFNVLLPAAAGCSIFAPLVVNDLLKNSVFGKISLWLLAIQICLLLKLPWTNDRNIVNADDENKQELFYQYISKLSGEVWVPHDVIPKYYTKKNQYAEERALHEGIDVNDSTSKALSHELDTALENHHWNYIITDAPQYIFPHYLLTDSVINSNKVCLSTYSHMFIYTPYK